MQFDRMEAVVRPRNHWESIDLGFSMVHFWWKPLWKIWCMVMLPVFLLCLFLIYAHHFLTAMLILWWLKPAYDRILLSFFSAALFGEQPNILHYFKGLLNTKLLLSLTFWRFDLARSFHLPILQLEGLKGKVLHQRSQLLHKNTGSTARWLTIVSFHFEWLLSLSIIGWLYFMTPSLYSEYWFSLWDILFNEKNVIVSMTLDIIRLFFGILVIGIIEPLYVAAGFALYLNRRTHLEAWDIELDFRRIREHLNKSVVL